MARTRGAKDKKKRKSKLLRNLGIAAGGTALVGGAFLLGRRNGNIKSVLKDVGDTVDTAVKKTKKVIKRKAKKIDTPSNSTNETIAEAIENVKRQEGLNPPPKGEAVIRPDVLDATKQRNENIYETRKAKRIEVEGDPNFDKKVERTARIRKYLASKGWTTEWVDNAPGKSFLGDVDAEAGSVFPRGRLRRTPQADLAKETYKEEYGPGIKELKKSLKGRTSSQKRNYRKYNILTKGQPIRYNEERPEGVIIEQFRRTWPIKGLTRKQRKKEIGFSLLRPLAQFKYAG